MKRFKCHINNDKGNTEFGVGVVQLLTRAMIECTGWKLWKNDIHKTR